LVLGAMATGALFGGGIVWLSLVAARTRNWALQRRLGKAEKRAATAEDQLAATSAGPGTGTDQKQPKLPPSRRL
ncbi:MAG: LapA family protein, partial [Pseudomonadota bacterium]|nr:LapA family protein [Pseudomonadota bacterium]